MILFFRRAVTTLQIILNIWMQRTHPRITFALSDRFCPNTNPPDELEAASPLFSLFGDLFSPLI